MHYGSPSQPARFFHLLSGLSIAIAAATTVALADLAGAWLYGIPNPVDPRLIATGLGLVAVTALVPFLTLGAVCHALRRSKGDAMRVFAIISLGACVCFFIGRLAYSDHLHGNLFSFQLFEARSTIGVMALSGIVLVWYALDRFRGTARPGKRLRLSELRLMVLAPLALALVLLVGYHLNADKWPSAPVWIGIFALTGVIHTLIFAHGESGNHTVLGVAACLGVLVLPSVSESLPVAEATPDTSDARGAPQHVLLLSVDTLRADALSCYGSTYHATPAMDAIAADGVRYANARSASSWTVPSLPSIMTGLSPLTHETRSLGGIHDGCLTLAEIFSERGYRTGAIGKNPHFHRDARNMEQGFDRYKWFPVIETRIESWGVALARRFHPERWPLDANTTGLTEQAIQWYSDRAGEKTFLWLHYFDPHLPYTPPAEFLNETQDASIRNAFDPSSVEQTLMRFDDNTPEAKRARIIELYHAEVRYVDHQIGRLTAMLKEQGLYDDMLIVFTSDHGEELFEHGGFAHGHTLHDEVIRVPLFIKPPGDPTPAVVEAPVSTVDVLPTLVDHCGFEIADLAVDGESIRGIEHASDGTSRPVVSAATMFAGNQRSIVKGTWKAILKEDALEPELYDTEADHGEKHDIARSNKSAAGELMLELEAYTKRARELRRQLGIETTEANFSEALFENLRSLGYF